MANNITPKLKAYVQVDATGRVVSGTPVFRTSKPKSGKWREIPTYYRGDSTTTSTTTVAPTTTTTTTVTPTTTTTTSSSTSTTTTTIVPTTTTTTTVVPTTTTTTTVEPTTTTTTTVVPTTTTTTTAAVTTTTTTVAPTTTTTTTALPAFNFELDIDCRFPGYNPAIIATNIVGSTTGFVYLGGPELSESAALADITTGVTYNINDVSVGTPGGWTIGQTYWLALRDTGNPSRVLAKSITITACP